MGILKKRMYLNGKISKKQFAEKASELLSEKFSEKSKQEIHKYTLKGRKIKPAGNNSGDILLSF